MKFTSASANKLIRTLEDKKSYLLGQESNNSTYVLADGEKIEIPEYDFNETNRQIDEIDLKIRTLKHALNAFNTTTVLPIGITIDQALVEMAQLNNKLPRLDSLRRAKNKTRLSGGMAARRDVAEYQYLNYKTDDVEKVYEENLSRVQQIQLALDRVNQTEEFEVDITE